MDFLANLRQSSQDCSFSLPCPCSYGYRLAASPLWSFAVWYVVFMLYDKWLNPFLLFPLGFLRPEAAFSVSGCQSCSYLHFLDIIRKSHFILKKILEYILYFRIELRIVAKKVPSIPEYFIPVSRFHYVPPLVISYSSMMHLLQLMSQCWYIIINVLSYTPSVQFSSVAQSCPTLCHPMNCSTPGLLVHYQLPEFTQTHVHRVGDTIQPSHRLSSPFPPAPIPSSIRVFSNESTLRMRWPKYWSFLFCFFFFFFSDGND